MIERLSRKMMVEGILITCNDRSIVQQAGEVHRLSDGWNLVIPESRNMLWVYNDLDLAFTTPTVELWLPAHYKTKKGS